MLYILGLVAIVLLVGKFNLLYQFNKQVKLLFAQNGTSLDQIFSQSQLKDLPIPVQRYFKLVLKEGQPYINSIKMTHDGQFKPGLEKSWINIEGEHYATMRKPGFIWKGTTARFIARDMYIKDEGRLIVTLLSLVDVVDAKGENYNQGELLRWLGESVLYPTNLLPCERIQWIQIDPQKAKLAFSYNGLSLFFIVSFNEIGEITQMETKRYMNEKLETWVIKLENYEEKNDVYIPTSFEVLWRLPKGDFSYAKFHLKEIEFNIK